jgi:acyl-CoA synthetase (AMP-forming)/AMP-acid ligase II
MHGLMMNTPLMISSVIRHADLYHGDTEVVTRLTEGGIHRYTYSEAHKRMRRLANAMLALGIKPADRVGTLAWNNHRHLELYYAISGVGAICHTINPRLFPAQIAYIINHAEDGYLFLEPTFVPLLEKLTPQCKGIRGYVVMTDRAHMPQTMLPNVLCYEDLIDAHSDDLEWPEFDENTASSLCYSSGTTGNPKGVLYSHRSTLLHALAVALPDSLNLSARDACMPVVPMFHVNAWGIPYAAPLVGAKLVLPGPAPDASSLYELFEQEKVTFTSGVPTVWLGLLQYMQQKQLKFSSLRRVIVGGSACPPAVIRSFQEQYGVQVLHGWGMTETSPVGVVNTFKRKHEARSQEEKLALQAKQGRPLYGVELKIVGSDGKELPRDGKAFGDLMIRGPWVTDRYFRSEAGDALRDGWFPTGDVATLDADGYIQITDRSKDVIKSGGEWISSIDLENVAVGHPGVAEAAVISVSHPKWGERPLLIVVRKPGMDVSREELLTFYEGKVAKWCPPDDVVFVDSLPHTATGKLLKAKLREDFRSYKLPTA